jgi:hypothetical protein
MPSFGSRSRIIQRYGSISEERCTVASSCVILLLIREYIIGLGTLQFSAARVKPVKSLIGIRAHVSASVPVGDLVNDFHCSNSSAFATLAGRFALTILTNVTTERTSAVTENVRLYDCRFHRSIRLRKKFSVFLSVKCT